MASYFGEYKASRLLIKKGADSTSAAFAERPLNVSKDKFARDVLQNLNRAAVEANDRDIKYLVNCGSKIDNRSSIFNEAPIHKAVLSIENEKQKTLASIINDCNADVNQIDANGWSALHHASSTGDYDSAVSLLEAGAKVNAYSNQIRVPLHLAANNNHVELVQLLLD